MCANYSPTRAERLAAFGAWVGAAPDISDEVYPGDFAPIARNGIDGGLCLATFGMIPQWAAPKLARMTYNARAETVHQKPSYRGAWRNRQFCIIPVERVYEPNYESGRAIRYAIAAADGKPLGLAGLWEQRIEAGSDIPAISFTMLTVNADHHPVMRRLFRPEEEKRMTVILDAADYDRWLGANESQARDLLRCFAAERLTLTAAPRPPRSKPAQADAEPSLF